MSGTGGTIVWFRLDLRVEDNPALAWAAARGGPIVPVYVFAPEEEGEWPPGAASRWWLDRSLAALAAALEARGSRLILRSGPSGTTLLDLARATGAGAVAWNRRSEPALRARDRGVEALLSAAGLETTTFNGHLLFDPDEVRTRAGDPFQVFTPFWRACLTRDDPGGRIAAPARLPAPPSWPASETIASFGLAPRIAWDAGLAATWTPGEAGARAGLTRFLDAALDDYPAGRDRPDLIGTSRLSPHLHFGEIAPRAVWGALERRAAPPRARAGRAGAARTRASAPRNHTPTPRPGAIPGDPIEAYRRELGWREFAHHLLEHFPHTPGRPLHPGFARFPWRRDPGGLDAWRRGRTGYPIVDAGMRELWRTGWMHNRVRMIVASFLVKDLLVSWTEGARWFWDTLVDADLANNTLGWQWSAGSGADAAPFFRIFNPVTQGRRFDPAGEYVARFVPELAALPAAARQAPWEGGGAPPEGYPGPIVDHAAARRRALAAFASRATPRRPGSAPRRRPGRTRGSTARSRS